MKFEDAEDGTAYDPILSLIENSDEVFQVEFTEFALGVKAERGVPVKFVETVR